MLDSVRFEYMGNGAICTDAVEDATHHSVTRDLTIRGATRFSWAVAEPWIIAGHAKDYAIALGIVQGRKYVEIRVAGLLRAGRREHRPHPERQLLVVRVLRPTATIAQFTTTVNNGGVPTAGTEHLYVPYGAFRRAVLGLAEPSRGTGGWAEKDGTIAYDESVAAADGTYVSGPTLRAPGLLIGDNDTAMLTAATVAKNVTLPAGITAVLNGAAWTFAALVNITNLGESAGDLLGPHSGSHARCISTAFGGGAGFGFADGLTAVATGVLPLTSATTTLVAWTYTGTTLTCIKNGVVVLAESFSFGGDFAGTTALAAQRA